MRTILLLPFFACFGLFGCGGGDSAHGGGGAGGSTAASSGTKGSSSSSKSSGSNTSSSSSPEGATTTGAGGAGTPPNLDGCAIFPENNPWNTPIDTAKLHPKAATYAASMAPSTHLHPDWGDWSQDAYGIPWDAVPENQMKLPISFDYADESDKGPYPFPPTARIEGMGEGDAHVLILQEGACVLWEGYGCSLNGASTKWHCGSGAKFDLSSNKLRKDGWTSADAAGLPIMPGLVKVAEIKAGVVAHAIRFTVNRSFQGYIHPATHAAGDSDPSLPPMGLRVRLKADFDTSSFKKTSQILLTAMKKYGLIVADNGSDWYFSGDSDDAWNPYMDDLVSDFENVHGSDFEAVDTGPTSEAGL